MTNREIINPDTDAISAFVAKKKAGEKKEDTKEKKDPKDGHIPVDTPKGASWISIGISGLVTIVVSTASYGLFVWLAEEC